MAQYTLSTPSPAYTQEAQCPSTTYSNLVDDFFGASATHESRHDNRHSVEIPPSYVETLPEYSPRGEPVTLAMYLFKFGFLFPPFWLFGVIILMSPLRAPEPTESSPVWLPEKSDEERQFIITEMRRVELKWAKRCLWALIALTLTGVATGIIIWASLRR